MKCPGLRDMWSKKRHGSGSLASIHELWSTSDEENNMPCHRDVFYPRENGKNKSYITCRTRKITCCVTEMSSTPGKMVKQILYYMSDEENNMLCHRDVFYPRENGKIISYITCRTRKITCCVTEMSSTPGKMVKQILYYVRREK